jgi:microcin C transport system permease protein
LFAYIIRRILLMIPTVFVIVTITFVIIQFVPGGPLDQIRDMLEGTAGKAGMEAGASQAADRGRREGIAPEDLAKLKAVYNLDRPLLERYARTFVWFDPPDEINQTVNIAWPVGPLPLVKPAPPLAAALLERDNWDGMLLFKFGDSFYGNRNVLELIRDKLPVSISLGFWSFLITYPACILLGIRKAVKEGTSFDAASTMLILVGYSIPGFVLAVLLIVLFGPGDAALLCLFPLNGLTSAGTPGYDDWATWVKLLDYLHHLIAPILCLSIGSFAVLTVLTKNSILEEIRKQYVTTARAKGVSERRILYRHVLRNAMIPLVTGFPSNFVAIFFAGSVLIERIFNLDGIGLLAYNSVTGRDYPVVMGNLFIMTLLGLLIKLVTDICYVVVDPRISFENART